ncbi:MAG TPA: histidine kinase dimerization/phospho-acceptor domain-containing protein, partial [Terriglobia bacterium]|nr:histidine kinase dimerization/phospho-acceptor domain-containing protein [Terriglobia bacterium]
MRQRHSFAWMDLLWVIFLVGLAALPPVEQIPEAEPAFHKYLILIAIGLLQIFEHRILELLPKRGRVYIVLLKICLASLLVDHTGGIWSSYYLIYFVPVVTAAMYFDVWATLAWTTLTCAIYWSFVIWKLADYELTGKDAAELAIRNLFFFLAALIVNRFVTENRRQAMRYRELAETLAETNRRLEQAQEDARRSERLAALGQLSGGLAHELRNPLAVIKGSAETLTRKLSISDPITTELAGYISSEVNRMNSLVTRFLDFARPHNLEPHREQIPPLIERGLKAARDRWPDAKVEVERQFAANLPEVSLDGDLIERVFTNLALNAYEAMGPGGGKLRVAAFPSSDGMGGVEVTFQDTGPGIPAALREQIFNPFFTTKESGVGLGLS